MKFGAIDGGWGGGSTRHISAKERANGRGMARPRKTRGAVRACVWCRVTGTLPIRIMLRALIRFCQKHRVRFLFTYLFALPRAIE